MFVLPKCVTGHDCTKGEHSIQALQCNQLVIIKIKYGTLLAF
jgi:hypothetical protein